WSTPQPGFLPLHTQLSSRTSQQLPISFGLGFERCWIPDERSARFVIRVALKRRRRFLGCRQPFVAELVRMRRSKHRRIRPRDPRRETVAIAEEAIALDDVGLVGLEPAARDSRAPSLC